MASAPAYLSLLQTTGHTGLIETPDGWSADLGTVQAGEILRTFSFGLLNNGDTDTLVATFATGKDDAAIHVFGTNVPFEMEPSSGRGAIAMTMDTAQAGHHAETLVIHVKSVGADGTETALPDAVVSVSYDVAGPSLPGPLPAGAYSASAPAEIINTSAVILDGTTWARAQYVAGWTESGSFDLHPSAAEVASLGGNFLISTFRTVQADLASSGAEVHAVHVIGGESGSVTVGAGSQSVRWSFSSDGSAASPATISTGAGDDTITLTAVGLDSHPGQLDQASILPYAIYPTTIPRGGPTYDGSASKAVVDAGTGNDHLILAAPVATTIRVHAGDGNDTVDGYLEGIDRLEIHGVAASSIKVTQTGGDTLVAYGSGSILLHGVEGFDPGSISILDAPVAPVGEMPPLPDTFHYPAADDWPAVGKLVSAFHAATGWWATLQQIEDRHWTPPGSGPVTPQAPSTPCGNAHGGDVAHAVDWNALAAQATANFLHTGYWFV